MRGSVWRLAPLFCVAVLAGCSQPPPDAMVAKGWAATFEDARELEQGSEFAQLVLADDEVTDAEMLEANRLLVDCLEAAGFPGSVVDDRGGLIVPDRGLGEDVNPFVAECEDSLGWPSVSMLYHHTRRNPGNVDNDELMAACLVRHGVVPSSYRGRDHAADWQCFIDGGAAGDTYRIVAFSDAERGPDVYRACETDPLG